MIWELFIVGIYLLTLGWTLEVVGFNWGRRQQEAYTIGLAIC